MWEGLEGRKKRQIRYMYIVIPSHFKICLFFNMAQVHFYIAVKQKSKPPNVSPWKFADGTPIYIVHRS